MTPFDYSAFRNALGRSSGFQSQQYRLLEFILGNKHAAMIEVHQHQPQVFAEFKRAGNA
jgi:tryptophan 2,3-dioxygenase